MQWPTLFFCVFQQMSGPSLLKRALFTGLLITFVGCSQSPFYPPSGLPASGYGGSSPLFFTSPLVVAHSQKCFAAADAVPVPGTALVQQSCDDSEAQAFIFRLVTGEPGTYTLEQLSSGLCVEVASPESDDANASPKLQACTRSNEQSFLLDKTGAEDEPDFRLGVSGTDTCVDVPRGSFEDGTPFITYPCHRNANQQWYLTGYPLDSLPQAPFVLQGSSEVAPIPWSSFTTKKPDDAVAKLLRTALLNANKYILTTWWDETFDAQNDSYLDFGGFGEHAIRHPAAAAVGLAISLKLGVYDASYTGVGLKEAKAKTLLLINSLTYWHRANSAQGWGNSWQSALWAHKTGLTAWLLWDDLTAEDRGRVEALLEAEADRFIGYQVPYYRDLDGNILSSGDTKAEENAWNASLLHLAVTMMPDHPHRHAWTYKNIELKASAYAQPSDLDNAETLHGRPYQTWLYGSNANDDGLVINHKRVHPDYMAAIEHHLEGAIVSSLALQRTPAAALANVADTYAALTELEFTPGSPYPDTRRTVQEPGGTLYQQASGDLYYPQGNDWGTDRIIPYVLLDSLVASFGYNGAASRKANDWAELHTTKLLDMQNRFEDGRTYKLAADTRDKCTRYGISTFSKEDSYCGREAYVNEFVALAYLGRWLTRQNAFDLENTARAIVIDNKDREFSLESGSWRVDDTLSARLGKDARSAPAGEGDAVARFSPILPEAALYSVYAWWPCSERNASDAPYTVRHAKGATTVRLDTLAVCGQWQPLGVFSFTGSPDDHVDLSNDADGHVLADAIMFVPQPLSKRIRF